MGVKERTPQVIVQTDYSSLASHVSVPCGPGGETEVSAGRWLEVVGGGGVGVGGCGGRRGFKGGSDSRHVVV